MSDERFMRLAIGKAREGIEKGQLPFGACIVKDGVPIGLAHNTIYEDMDIIAHAETNAISDACKKLRTIDLSGCTLYCTCEPCAMCFGACVLANIGRIVYGVGMEHSKIEGFSILDVGDEELNRIGNGRIEIIKDILKNDNIELIKYWEERKKK
jgi:guanine deaminase